MSNSINGLFLRQGTDLIFQRVEFGDKLQCWRLLLGLATNTRHYKGFKTIYRRQY